ncbi:MAG: fibronectin type III-like domain-contianing protein, partial [Fermentimonas sp.]|nr:fibronectin type III-like domain-contianing protein [Fermentimonas sp.]MDD4698224.1 fibronectin type III-like domain-contianing protein [Fermentimonas sp.]
GETKEIELTVNSDAFEFYDERTDGLILKAGSYTLMYGGTSAEGGLKSVNIVVEIN